MSYQFNLALYVNNFGSLSEFTKLVYSSLRRSYQHWLGFSAKDMKANLEVNLYT